MQRILSLIVLALLAAPGRSADQDTPQDEEMKFVRQLRERGFPDLALEYLDKHLRNNAKYGADLPLEIASTRLEMATAEPDPGKRVSLFAQARTELDTFLKNNASHPRAADARFLVAQVAVLQGKTQLTRALALPDNDDNRDAELLKARRLFVEARKELEATAARINTEQARNKADVELGLLLMAQARTYGDREETSQDKVLKEARDLLEKAANRLDDKDPLRFIALAWIGRSWSLGGEPSKAGTAFNQITGSSLPTAAAGKRLARYFELLADFDKPDSQDKRDNVARILIKAIDWNSAYRAFRNTPEGQGVQYILARQYYNLGLLSRAERSKYWPYARQFASELEKTDNEFTIRAQQIKIDILFETGAFSKPLTQLITFDECYMRAQYEAQQLNRYLASPFDDLFPSLVRWKQQRVVIAALNRAFDFAKKSKPPEVDLANAYYLLLAYHLNLGDKDDVIRIGEEFVHALPRARQASVAALWTADALDKAIREGAGDAADDFTKMEKERRRLYELGKYMAERWPGDKAGNYGQFLITDYLLKKPLLAKTPPEQDAEKLAREKELLSAGDFGRWAIARERLKEGKHLDAIRLLKDIQPDFPRFSTAQLDLARSALEIDKDNAQKKDRGEQLVKLAPGDNRSFNQIALEALERIPDPAPGAEPELSIVFLRAKLQATRLYSSAGQFDRVLQLTQKVLGMLDGLAMPKGVNKADFRTAFVKMHTFALYSQADADNRAGRYADAATRLQPVVKDLGDDKLPEVKEDTRLTAGVLGLALRGNIQSQQLGQAKAVLDVWKKVDKNPEAINNILKQTIINFTKQIEELRKKKDKDKLNKTIDGFDAFLDLVAKDVKDPKTDFILVMAQGYLGIHKYAKAIKLLEKAPAPDPKVNPKNPRENPKDREESLRRVLRVLLIRAYRLEGKENGDMKSLKKAEALLDAIMDPLPPAVPKGKPVTNWGRRDLNALMEEIYLYVDLKYFGAAVNRANAVLKVLESRIKDGGLVKDRYYETYFLFVYAWYKYGQGQTDATKRTENVKKAADHLSKLVTNHPDMGGEEAKKRFDDLLNSDEGAELRQACDELKKHK